MSHRRDDWRDESMADLHRRLSGIVPNYDTKLREVVDRFIEKPDLHPYEVRNLTGRGPRFVHPSEETS